MKCSPEMSVFVILERYGQLLSQGHKTSVSPKESRSKIWRFVSITGAHETPPIKMIELHLFVQKESGCLSSAEHRCSNKNATQDLQEIVGEPYYCHTIAPASTTLLLLLQLCVFGYIVEEIAPWFCVGDIVEDLYETVVLCVWYS